MKNQVIVREEKNVKVSIDVFIKKQGENFIAYCPALEVSSYGATRKEAKAMFEEALQIFIEETTAMGTFEKVLLELGWKLQLKPVAKFTPPSIRELSKNDSSLLTLRGIKEEIAIPI